jgi:N-acetylmuramoyl-L-alanine amidase
MLLDVGNKVSASHPKKIGIAALLKLGLLSLGVGCLLLAPLTRGRFSLLSIAQAQHRETVTTPSPNQAPAAQSVPAATPTTQTPATQTPAAGTPSGQAAQRQAPSIVVLDPAHGGTDLGARGTAGIRESEIVLQFAAQVRTALESQGFQVMQTRQGNENPSFDDRSAIANSQRGAVFVSLHIGSTGLPGTVRVYVMSDLPTSNDGNGLIPWDRAQAPFVPLSRRWGDLVQGFLSQRFKGSPSAARTGAVRQLRTTAAPAIAVEVSSVTMEDRNALDRMAPGVADAIARGASAFRPLYVVAAVNPGERP